VVEEVEEKAFVLVVREVRVRHLKYRIGPFLQHISSLVKTDHAYSDMASKSKMGYNK